MRNSGLDEAQAGIKIAGRNIKNFTYADDITIMAESEEELKSFLMKLKQRSEKFGLKLNNLENSAAATGLKTVSFNSNPKERQCQRMLKLQYNCAHFTCLQRNAQNPLS